MPAQVKLTVTQGQLRGREFIFSEATTCVIGRASDANLRLPDDQHHRTVSRHHCLLEFNPPEARVRDFGSLNGTWLNNTKIGQREPGHSPEQGAAQPFPEHDLTHGDELRLGETILRIDVVVSTLCAQCQQEIPEPDITNAPQPAGVQHCRTCRRDAERSGPSGLPRCQAKRCVVCDKDVTAEVGQRPGDVACASCRADPDRVMHRLARAGTGVFASYMVEKMLGRGGMGAVYLARHTQTGQRVALKVMLPQVATLDQPKERFLRETANITALTHPHIVRVHDHGCWKGIFYFAMDYCSGGDTDTLLRRRNKPLPIDEALTIILQVLDGLTYAHQAEVPVTLHDGTATVSCGLVHRDLSLNNILLDTTGARISDFGLAKAFDLAGLSGFTRTGAAAGKPYFMPRQLVIDFRYAKPEVDVWAAAACLYYLLTHSPPRKFPIGKDPWRIVLQEPAVPIRTRNRAIPPRLATVVDDALIDRPHIAIKTATELRDALKDAHR